VILQRLFVCSFGFGLLVACGSGAATNPPVPSDERPSVNANSPISGSAQSSPGNTQSPPVNGQRPSPANSGGLVIVVGPGVTSNGGSGGSSGSGDQGGSDNPPGDGGRRGDNGGAGNMAGTGPGPGPGACSAADSCAGCDIVNDCLGYCNCANQLGQGTLDCATICAN